MGGTLLPQESDGDVSSVEAQSQSTEPDSIFSCVFLAAAGVLIFLNGMKTPPGGASNITNCDNLPARGQQIGERGGSLARRRYQRGSVILKGKTWMGR
jgi:hypothetical protein